MLREGFAHPVFAFASGIFLFPSSSNVVDKVVNVGMTATITLVGAREVVI